LQSVADTYRNNRRRARALPVAVALLTVSACASSPSSEADTSIAPGATAEPIATTPATTQPEPTTTPPTTLPTVQLDGVNFGYSLSSTALIEDSEYAKIVEGDATIVTPENDMKWRRIQPERKVYDFSRANVIVEEAQLNGQSVRGHVLVWHRQLPEWLEEGDWTRDELIAVMRDHITKVVGYYRNVYPGVVTQWDVVNEAFHSDGTRRETIWQEIIGDDYIELAFRFARDADPDALLFYNDFYDAGIVADHDGASADRSSCDDVPKCAATKELADTFVRSGVPIDGIGFEAHIFDLEPPNYLELASWTGPLGLQWALTEVDVALDGNDGDDSDKLNEQADVYEAMTTDCLDSPNCNTIVLWGVSDGHSWIPRESDDELGHALLYDVDYQPKPAATRILPLIQSTL
jgi:endo-1,4-beta-xylanase